MRFPKLKALLGAAALAIVNACGAAFAETPRAPLPVPHSFAAGIEAEAAHPGQDPPGANDWLCRPSAAHPEPVVLVHGSPMNATLTWQALAPLLANDGYCVFTLTYGRKMSALFDLGGLTPALASAQEVGGFIDRVRAATGASKVDVIDHSWGGAVVYYALTRLDYATLVDKVIGLAVPYHGSDGPANAAFRVMAHVPEIGPRFFSLCESCQVVVLTTSEYMNWLKADARSLPTVTFTDIVTRYDESATPYTTGLLDGPNVTNIVLQDQCPTDYTEHFELPYDPVAARDVLTALDPAHPQPPACTVVLPMVGTSTN